MPKDISDDYPNEFKLSKPINVFGELKDVLRYRDPTGADLIKIGIPMTPRPDTATLELDFNMHRLIQMVARLTNAPSSSLERMTTNDIVRWGWVLLPFFMPTFPPETESRL